MCEQEAGGFGVKKNLGKWNVAALGKQVWALAMKKDVLWVKWISSIYLKNEDFLSIQVKASNSWHWKQLLKCRNALSDGLLDSSWSAVRSGEYKIATAYEWLNGDVGRFRYERIVWRSRIIPKHSFILWLVLSRKLLTLDRLVGWGIEVVQTECILCTEEEESLAHLFFSCSFSREVLGAICHWLGIHIPLGQNRWRA